MKLRNDRGNAIPNAGPDQPIYGAADNPACHRLNAPISGHSGADFSPSSLVPANFEALSMLEIADQKLDHVKKAVIDAVIRDPDLDVAALNYHLQCLDLGSAIEDLTGDEMKSRLPFDPYALARNGRARI